MKGGPLVSMGQPSFRASTQHCCRRSVSHKKGQPRKKGSSANERCRRTNAHGGRSRSSSATAGRPARVAGRGRRQRARTKAQTKATVASHLPQRRPTIPQLDHPTPSGKEPAVRSLSLAAVLTSPPLRGRSRSRRHRCHRSALLLTSQRSVYRAARLSSIARQQSRADDPGTPSAISASLISSHVRRAHHPVHQPADLDLLGTPASSSPGRRAALRRTAA
jgi:hypothetical protein